MKKVWEVDFSLMSIDKFSPFETKITIPNGVIAQLDGSLLTIKGPLGKCSKDFSKIPIRIFKTDNQLIIQSYKRKKRDYAIFNTVQSHIKNMIKGVTKGYTYRLKIVYAHFPVSVKVKGKEVYIENFYGERSPRIAKIVGDCQVFVEGDDIVVKGVSKEDVGQTAANIELATKVKRKDQRVFLDGIYIYAKE